MKKVVTKFNETFTTTFSKMVCVAIVGMMIAGFSSGFWWVFGFQKTHYLSGWATEALAGEHEGEITAVQEEQAEQETTNQQTLKSLQAINKSLKVIMTTAFTPGHQGRCTVGSFGTTESYLKINGKGRAQRYKDYHGHPITISRVDYDDNVLVEEDIMIRKGRFAPPSGDTGHIAILSIKAGDAFGVGPEGVFRCTLQPVEGVDYFN